MSMWYSVSIPWYMLHLEHLLSFLITQSIAASPIRFELAASRTGTVVLTQSLAASPICFELVALHTGTVVWTICIVAVLAAGSINIALVEICKMETGTLMVACVVQRIIFISQSPKLRYFEATSTFKNVFREWFSITFQNIIALESSIFLQKCAFSKTGKHLLPYSTNISTDLLAPRIL